MKTLVCLWGLAIPLALAFALPSRAADEPADTTAAIFDAFETKSDPASAAESLYRARKYADAAASYAQLLRQEPRSQTYWLMHITCLRKAHQTDAALAAYEACFSNAPATRDQVLGEYVTACRSAGATDRALSVLRQIPLTNRCAADAWCTLADALQNAARWPEAAEAYSNAVASSSSSDQRDRYCLQLAHAQTQAGRPEAAEPLLTVLTTNAAAPYLRRQARQELLPQLRRAGRLDAYIAAAKARLGDPPNKAGLEFLAELSADASDYAAAAGYYGALVKLDPSENNFGPWINALQSAHAHTNLVAAYEEFFRLLPGRRNEQYLWGFAQALQQTGNTSNAVAVAHEWVEKSRDRRHAYQQLAEFCRNAGRVDEALAAWDKAIALAPSAAEKRNAVMGKIRLLSSCNRDKEAREVLRQLQQDGAADENDANQMNWLVIETLQKSNELQAYLQELAKKPADKLSVPDLMLLGNGYQRVPDHARSVAAFRKLFARQPTENHAFSLVNALTYAGDHAAAVETCQEMLRRFPDRKALFLGNLMHAQQQLQHVDEAIAAGEEILRLEPQSTHLYQQLAQICRTAKRYDQAIAYYQKLLAGAGAAHAAGNRPHYQLELADVLLEAGRPDAAQAQVDAVIAARPETHLLERATELSNRILRQTGKWEAHVQELEQQNLTTTNAVVLLQLAAAYTEKNDLAAAAGVYARLVRLDPAVNYYEKWIDALGQLKDYARQIEAIQAFRAKHADYKDSYLNALETAYTETGNFDRAIETVLEIERVTGNHNEGFKNQRIAQLLRKAGRAAEAIPYLEKAVQLSTSYQRNQCAEELLALCQETGDDDKLEKSLVMVLPFFGDLVSWRQMRGDKLKAALQAVCARHAEFVEEYCRAADTHPDDLQAQSVAEVVCQFRDRQDDAARYRRRAVDLLARAADAAPDNCDLQMKVGQLCVWQQEPARAIPYYERALKLRPDENACTHLSEAYQACKLYDKQIALLEATATNLPHNLGYRFSRVAHAYLAEGQKDKALALAKKVADVEPNNPARRTLLVDFYAQLGQLDNAIAAYRAMREEAAKKQIEWYQRREIDYALVAIATKSKEDPAKLLAFLRGARGEITDANAKQTLDAQIARLAAPPDDPGAVKVDDGRAAIQLLETESADNPQNPVPLLNLATAYRRLGDHVKEAATLRRLVAVDGNPKNYLALIACLAAAKDPKGVVETYEALLAARPAVVPAQAAAYVSAAGQAGMLDAVADKWAAVLATTPDDRTATAVQAAVQSVRARLRSPGRKVPDAAQPDVTWFIPEKGFPIRMEKAGLDDFHAFASGMNLLQVKVTGLVPLGKQAWLATDRGVFQFNQENRQWEEIGLDATHLGKPIESVATNAAGRIVFTANIDGKRTSYALDPATERWSKP